MINLADKFAPMYDDFIQDVFQHRYTHYWLKGGRGSLKSSTVELLIPLLLAQNKDVHAVILRKVGNTLRTSVYNAMCWAIGELGMTHLFKFNKVPLEITFKPTGQKIMFFGLDDKVKLKSIKTEFGRIGIVFYEECDQFTGMEEIRNVNQSLIRNSGDNWVFYCFNPPMSRNNWCNEEVLLPRSDKRVIHTTFLDVPRKWLGEQFFIEANYLRETNETRYNHEYLGEVTGTGGNVFRNVTVRPITSEEIENATVIYNGLDFGFAVDPTAFIRVAMVQDKLYLLDEIFEQELPTEDLYTKITKKISNYERVTCDSAEPRTIAQLTKLGLNADKSKKGKDSIHNGIKFLQDLREIIIDPKRTPNAMREFVGYEYARNKDGQFLSAYVDKDNHIIDATRYALESVMRSKRGSWGWK